MTAIQDILRMGVAIQATGLAGENIKLLKKRITTKNMVKTSLKNIVGVNLLRIQSDVISEVK